MNESRLRPRSISELVDALFALLRQHYVALLTVAGVGLAPVIALFALAIATAGSASGAMLVPAILAAVALFPLTISALTVATSDAYLNDRVDVGDAFRRAARRLPAVFGAYLLLGLALIVGAICLLVGAVYASAALFALPVIVLLEERGPLSAASRSSDLSKGRKRAILGAILLVSIIGWLLSAAVQVVGALTMGELGANVASMVMMVLLLPMNAAVPVLLYYDARVRKEGFDLELDAAKLAAAA